MAGPASPANTLTTRRPRTYDILPRQEKAGLREGILLRDRDNRHPGFHRRPDHREEGHRSTPPESTNREVEYIKYLIEKEIPVVVRLSDNQEVTGVIEYYDLSFIRLTRKNQPNLFIFKREIKYLYEVSKDRSKP
jgi:hypothetical protein